MKFSEQWLREWVNPHLTTQQLADQLTMAGLEVDAIAPVANEFSGVVVGEILSMKPHPNADRLRICQVDIGAVQPLELVCGGVNARMGLKAPVATLGAQLSPEFSIKTTKIRGVESSGMLCSTAELGLTETAEGLMELPKDAPVGKDLRKYLNLDDHILTLKITPNRGDCLSILGVAREVAALNQIKIKQPKIKSIAKKIADKFLVKISAEKNCPRYIGRVIRNIDMQSSTPLWIQERLRRGGIRSVNCIVDIANYVMLELGQPLHVFDLDKLNKHVDVRLAKKGERIALLDGQEIELDTKTLVIADAVQPHAIAGVMGGNFSAISESTQNIFLESAFFTPETIAYAVQHYHLLSDASHRFQLGVDPELSIRAMERGSELILQIAGGKPGPTVETVKLDKLPEHLPIKLRRSRIPRILGVSILDAETVKILQQLGMKVIKDKEGWEVTVPSFRFDIILEIDLIEELARIYGYDRIPVCQPTAKLSAKTLSENELSLARIRNFLGDRGYFEAITYSFVSPSLQELFDPEHKAKILANPISQEMSVMRTTLCPGLVQAALYNQHRQENRIRLFESGLCFIEKEGQLYQEPHLAGLVIGDVYPEQWDKPKVPGDFFDVKGDVEGLLALTGAKREFTFNPSSHPALHPTQSAQICRDGQRIGYIGSLHPNIQQQLQIDGPIYIFELNLANIKNRLMPIFKPISKFPMVRRDIAMILSQNITAAQIQQKIVDNSNELLKNVELFDIYQGKGIDLGKKSVAVGLTFQHPSRTLMDDEVNGFVQKIVSALNQEFGATLRE